MLCQVQGIGAGELAYCAEERWILGLRLQHLYHSVTDSQCRLVRKSEGGSLEALVSKNEEDVLDEAPDEAGHLSAAHLHWCG